MSVLEGSQYFTTHPPVLTAPCAPIDPVREEVLSMRTPEDAPKVGSHPHKFASLVVKNQQKEAISGRSLVIPCFNIQLNK